MKDLKLLLFLIFLTIVMNACGKGSSAKNSSVFSENNNSPEILGKKVYYVKENTREAFQIKANDKSPLRYSLSGEDFFDLYIDEYLGKVYFKTPTKFSKKSVYKFTIIVEDSIGHVSTKSITIYVKKGEFETPIITTVNIPQPLSNLEEEKYFISVWKTDNQGTSKSNQIHIPTRGDGYNYTVDWGDGTSTKQITADITHTYDNSGVYEVKIFGDFPYLAFGKTTDWNMSTVNNDSRKLLDIKQWGKIKWTNMWASFAECTNLTGTAIDSPDLSKVTNLSNMFHGAKNFNGQLSNWDISSIKDISHMFTKASSFNQDISSWNTSNISSLQSMFFKASKFNQDISSWDVSNVTNMSHLFENADAFNQALNSWNTSKVTDMSYLFTAATSFNQNINNWDTSSVTNMIGMFALAHKFNQPLNNWDVSNVANMGIMFLIAYDFNQPLNNWNTAKVTNMESLFKGASSFNQDLTDWDVHNVNNMNEMFFDTALQQTPSWYKK